MTNPTTAITIPLVDDYMTRNVYSLSRRQSIQDAVDLLLANRISGAPVLDADGSLVGILSQRDCLPVIYSASYHQDFSGRVDEYMTSDVETMAVGTSIVQATDFFLQSRFRRFPVLSGSTLVGIIGRQDLLVALRDHWMHAVEH